MSLSFEILPLLIPRLNMSAESAYMSS